MSDHTIETTIPEPLRLEHEELHEGLARATRAGGRTGQSATVVAEILHPHFVKEEAYALPPLGLLPRLARGEVTPEMAAVLPMTDRLAAELPDMLDEHGRIVAALEALAAAAREEGKPEHAALCEKLVLHARTEEEVLYPAAILIGAHVRARLGR